MNVKKIIICPTGNVYFHLWYRDSVFDQKSSFKIDHGIWFAGRKSKSAYKKEYPEAVIYYMDSNRLPEFINKDIRDREQLYKVSRKKR